MHRNELEWQVLKTRETILGHLQQEPPFPGSEEDKRTEPVVEIQRTWYVLRMGSDLKETKDGPLSKMILSLLRIDPTQQSCDECRRAQFHSSWTRVETLPIT
jgi:hypothetical protein